MSPKRSEAAGVLAALSDELAAATERAGRSVVAVHARRRIPASGVYWREGAVVVTHHTLEREEGITVTLPDGSTTNAELAGRDPVRPGTAERQHELPGARGRGVTALRRGDDRAGAGGGGRPRPVTGALQP